MPNGPRWRRPMTVLGLGLLLTMGPSATAVEAQESPRAASGTGGGAAGGEDGLPAAPVRDEPVGRVGRFQAGSVQYLDAPAHVSDQSIFLQALSSMGNAFSAHTQHVGDQLLCHHQLIRRHPVMAQEQPAAELLLQRVQTVADSRL